MREDELVGPGETEAIACGVCRGEASAAPGPNHCLVRKNERLEGGPRSCWGGRERGIRQLLKDTVESSSKRTWSFLS